jgi:hypothetical protein
MQSLEEHQEIPKEEAAMMPVGGLKKWCRDRNLAAGCRQKPKGRIQEEIDHRRQDDLLCNSGMAQEKRLQKNWDPGKLWTVE